MEWPDEYGPPVVLNAARPGRNRGRLNSEHPNRSHQPLYYHDVNGALLMPAGADLGAPLNRAHSVATARRPASIVINNTHWDDHSPGHSPHSHHHHRRHNSHGREYVLSDEEDWEHCRGHSPPRRRRAASRSPSPMPLPLPMIDPEIEHRLRRLDELEAKEKEEEQRKRFEEQKIIEEARQVRKKKEEEEMKKKAVEEWKLREQEVKMKKEKKKKEEDEAFQERAMQTFINAGYSKDSVEKMLKKAEKGEKGLAKERGILDLKRPTYIKVHRRHLSPDTLDEYGLPWQWDERNSDYLIIKRWIPEHEQDMLFEHTKKLRERKQLTDTTIELKKQKDNFVLVRKRSRSKNRRSWVFS